MVSNNPLWDRLDNARFTRPPLILGEAPSPKYPKESWSKEAITTQKLAKLIFGHTTDETLEKLFNHFHFQNLLAKCPQQKFPAKKAVASLSKIYKAGDLDGRVTFFMGNQVCDCLRKLPIYPSDKKNINTYNPELGCKYWFEIPNTNALFIEVPHPQTYFRFFSQEQLTNLGLLMQLAVRFDRC